MRIACALRIAYACCVFRCAYAYRVCKIFGGGWLCPINDAVQTVTSDMRPNRMTMRDRSDVTEHCDESIDSCTHVHVQTRTYSTVHLPRAPVAASGYTSIDQRKAADALASKHASARPPWIGANIALRGVWY